MANQQSESPMEALLNYLLPRSMGQVTGMDTAHHRIDCIFQFHLYVSREMWIIDPQSTCQWYGSCDQYPREHVKYSGSTVALLDINCSCSTIFVCVTPIFAIILS